MLLTLSASIAAAIVARYGKLSKDGETLTLHQWAGYLITGGVWGYVVAVTVSALRPELSPYAVIAAAAVSGYVGDAHVFNLFRSLARKQGLELPEQVLEKNTSTT